ncbi:MAG: thioesterase family protein [Microlunatus sp.]|nr:thioesterase family protein [Microlunatus sp.]
MTNAYYRRIGGNRFQPTRHTQGAWRDTEQHMGPASGLLAYALETVHPRDDLQLCRISYEILGVISAEALEIEVDVVRPGRTIEMLEARMIINGRPAIRATGWRLATSDTSAVAGGAPDPMPGPEHWPAWDVDGFWSGGYIDSLEFRVDTASVPGRSRAWLRTPLELVAGEQASDLATFTTLVDTANGVAARRHPRQWAFPNIDLTIHYFRAPAFTDPDRCWVGLDSTATWGADGIGLTSTALYDPSGAVGRAEQILTLREL